MREEFSLFSLGIGFDVDYDFLERIATENRGIAQRIYANHDAADQLRVRKLQGSKRPAHFTAAGSAVPLNTGTFSKIVVPISHLHTKTWEN